MDRAKATDNRSKKREVTQAPDVTEAAESKAITKATAAIEVTEAAKTDSNNRKGRTRGRKRHSRQQKEGATP